MPAKKKTRKRIPSSPKEVKIPKLNRFYAHPVYIENSNDKFKMKACINIIPGEIVSKFGLTRLFLHAESITFPGLSSTENTFSFRSKLDAKLAEVLEKLRSETHQI